MDPDALRDEVETWVRDGIITESQAEAILARYDDRDGRSRVVLALSAVGSALVFVGVALFLATNWDELPTVAQVAVLLAAPGVSYAGGIAAYRRSLPRIGLACCLLGSVLTGPSIFLLSDLAAVEIAETWLLLAWAAIALPTGHALESRVGIGFGIAVLAALVADLTGRADPIPSVAFLGIALFALGEGQRERIGWSYRTGGATLALFGLLLLTRLEGGYDWFAFEVTATLLATVVGSVAGVGWLSRRGDRFGGRWAGTAIVAVGASTGLAALAPGTVPELAAFLGGHVAMILAVAATGYYGYRSGARRFIDLAVLAALGQALSFVVATVIDSLSGSLALIVAGVFLLAVGIALERGRQTLLERLER